MGKRKKYTLDIIIGNKLAIERIRQDSLYSFVEEQDNQIIIRKRHMTATQTIKVASFLVSSIIHICCRPTDDGNIDNWSFMVKMMDSLSNIHDATDWEFTGTKFEEWITEQIEKNTGEDDNKTHTRVLFSGEYNKNANILVGYDWED